MRMCLIVLTCLFALAFAGCGGGGNSGSNDNSGSAANVAQAMITFDDVSNELSSSLAEGMDEQTAANKLANQLRSTVGVSDVLVADEAISYRKNGIQTVLYYRNLGSESEPSSEIVPLQNTKMSKAMPGNMKAVILNPDSIIFNQSPKRYRERLEDLGYQVDYFKDDDADISKFAQLGQYGVVFFCGHGSPDIWLTGQKIPDQETNPTIIKMLNEEKLVLSGHVVFDGEFFKIIDHQYGINSKFIKDQNYNQSVIITFSCKTMAGENELAKAFAEKGAQVYVGWNRLVYFNWDSGKMIALLDSLCNGNKMSDAVTSVNDPSMLYYPATGANANITEIPKKIAVTSSGFDDIGGVLAELGYSVDILDLADIQSTSDLEPYYAYCINCDSGIGGLSADQIEVIRRFVSDGGKIYASDWAYPIIEEVFPGNLTFSGRSGIEQSITAQVEDSQLSAFLGTPNLEIEFDLPYWVPIKSISPGVKVLLSGNYEYDETLTSLGGAKSLKRIANQTRSSTRMYANGPIAVSFDYGDGTAVYTSFHSHAQTNSTTRALMEYLAVL